MINEEVATYSKEMIRNSEGRQLRVLFLANSAEIGGGNRSLLTLATGLRKFESFPIVVSPRPGPIVEVCRENLLQCDVVNYVQPGWRELSSTWKAFRRWQSFLQEAQIDLIHANGVESARSIALVARMMKFRWSVMFDFMWIRNRLPGYFDG